MTSKAEVIETVEAEVSEMQTYTMKQACEKLGMSYETLKFYCRQGLVPNVQRDDQNHRVFDEKNIAWLEGLQCLRNCGMSLQQMRQYMQYCLQGEKSIPIRQEMLKEVENSLIQQMDELHKSLNFLHDKQDFYRRVLRHEEKYVSNLIDV